MSKYVGGLPTLQPKVNPIQEGILSGIQKGFENYQKERSLQAAQSVINDPNSSAIQKAMALASIGQEKLGTEVFKKSADEALIANVEADLQQKRDALLRKNLPSDIESGRTPNIRPTEPGQRTTTTPQGQAQSTETTQPGFSVSGPQRAAQNAMAVNQPREALPSGLEETVPGAQQPPQGQQQIDPIQEAELLDDAALKLAKSNPSLARSYENKANQIRKDVRAANQDQAKLDSAARKERLDIHNSLQKYNDEIDKEAKTAKSQINSFNVMEGELSKKELNPTNFKNLMRKSLENTRWKDFLLDPSQALFQVASLETYEGLKNMFGVRLSDADLALASGKVPSLDKTPQANIAIINFLRFQAQMKVAEQQIADEINQENGGYRPINLKSEVNKRMAERFGDQAEQVTRLAAYEGAVGPKFDITNPVHKARRNAILQAANGDRATAEQMLRQEFVP